MFRLLLRTSFAVAFLTPLSLVPMSQNSTHTTNRTCARKEPADAKLARSCSSRAQSHGRATRVLAGTAILMKMLQQTSGVAR